MLLRSLSEETQLLALLVERAQLDRLAVDAAEAHGGAAPEIGARLDWLLKTHRMTREAVDAGLADLRFAAAATIDPLDQTQRSDKHALPSGALRKQYGSYRLEVLLGRGGCGEVYRAHDDKLGRTVALKLLTTIDAEQHERLRREAQLQARIQHDNVCQVYEVSEGADGERGYIAMQFIDGADLGTVAARLSTTEIARLLERVADAIDAAHNLGLVHRDLKPSNILVERTREGGWKPYVVDFGLAREASAPGLTATGVVVGTAHYMSPEQARGDRDFDHRVDIYALGATLYELLCGEPPFDGETPLRVLQQVIADQPVPLRRRNPRIPIDLETIVHRCLEKEPKRRYQSAAALAADLRLFLDGRPIVARPPTLTYRLRLQLRRRRREFIVAAFGLGALVIVAALQVRQLIRARTEAANIRDYDTALAELARGNERLRFAPPHDTTPERRALREQIEALRGRVESRGRLGQAHGQYVLGRGYAILGEYLNAREHLERAWQLGPRTPRLAAALGQVFTMLYLGRRSPGESSLPPSARREEEAYLDQALRAPAMSYLREAEGGGADEEVLLASARLAMLARQPEQAIALATRAHEGRPWLSDADAVIAETHRLRCIALLDASALAEAEPVCQEAAVAAERAIQTARSDYALRILFAKIKNLQLDLATRRSLPVEPPYRAMRAAFADAAALLRDDPERDSIELMAVVARAIYDTDHGDDPRAYLKPTIVALDDSPPLTANHWRARLAGRYAMAEAALTFGGDPERDIEEGVKAAYAIMSLEPGASTEERLALMLRVRFESVIDQPEGEAAYGELVRICDRILLARPDDVDTANILGVAHLEWAGQLANGRRDNGEALTKASAAFEKSLGGQREAALYNLGAVALLRAERKIARSLDPTADLAAAITQLETALQLSPDEPNFMAGLTAAGVSQAGWLLSVGRLDEAARALEATQRWCERGSALAEHNPELLHRCGRSALLAVELGATRKLPQPPLVARAEQVATKFRQVLPRSRDSANLLGRVLLIRGAQVKDAKEAAAIFDRSEPLLDGAAASTPANGETAALRLVLQLLRADRRRDRGEVARLRAELQAKTAPTNGWRELEDERLRTWLDRAVATASSR